MLLPRCLKRHLFGFDVNDFGVCVKFITGGDDVCLISYGHLESRSSRYVHVGGQYRAK